MHAINIALWFVVVSTTLHPLPSQAGNAGPYAIAGLIFAILWQHGSVRGFFRAKKPPLPKPDDAAIANGPRNASSQP